MCYTKSPLYVKHVLDPGGTQQSEQEAHTLPDPQSQRDIKKIWIKKV